MQFMNRNYQTKYDTFNKDFIVTAAKLIPRLSEQKATLIFSLLFAGQDGFTTFGTLTSLIKS